MERTAHDLIADPVNDILFSIASLWEIVVKVRVGKLEADIRDIVAAIKPSRCSTSALSTWRSSCAS